MSSTETQLDTIRLLEECSMSPTVFAAQTQLDGVPFEPTNPQYHFYLIAERADHLVVTKARQVGITEAAVRYLLWKAIFKGETSLYFAPNIGMAEHAAELTLKAYRSLPGWMRSVIAPPLIMSRRQFVLDNGAAINFGAANLAAACGASAHNIFIDEAAFCTSDDFFYSIMPIMHMAHKTIIASSLNKKGDRFDQFRTELLCMYPEAE